MKYSVIEPLLKDSLEYIEVSPCTDAFFANVINNVHNGFTIVRLHFGKYEVVGSINSPYVYVYDMSTPPPLTAQTTAFPLIINNRNLGIKFDGFAPSAEWRAFIFSFTQLTALKADCQVEILIRIEQVLGPVLPNLRTFTVTVAEKDMSDDKESVIVDNSANFVTALTNKVLKVRTVTSKPPFNVPSCTSRSIPKQGLRIVEYTCITT